MDIKFDMEGLKRRFMGWLRDMILIFGMWCIWLVNKYVLDTEIKVVITGFLIAIIAITVLKQEYFVSLDHKAYLLERELLEIKNRR